MFGPRTLLLMALPLLTAVVVLAARDRSLRGLLRLRVRGLSLVAVAAGIRFLSQAETAWATTLRELIDVRLIECAIWTLTIAFVAVNCRRATLGGRAAWGLLAAGFSANTLAVLLNGAMPYSAPAARAAGVADAGVVSGSFRYEPITDATRVGWLGDVIPIHGLSAVVSIGDLMLYTATVALIGLLCARPAAPPAANDPTCPIDPRVSGRSSDQ